MRESKIRELIRRSAEDVEIPEGLMPDQIEEKLKRDLARRAGFVSKRGKYFMAYGICAAAVLVVCGYAFFRTSGIGSFQKSGASLSSGVMQQPSLTVEEAKDIAEVQMDKEAAPESVEEATEQRERHKEKKVDAGELYQVASDYQQVYDAVVQMADSRNIYFTFNDAIVKEGAMTADGAVTESSGAASDQDNGEIQELQSSLKYSGTNLQTEGVDESDIIKTDGSFLYVVHNNRVSVIDIRQGEPKKAADIILPGENSSSRICEIYVDADKLVVIAQENATQLKEVTQDVQGSGEADHIKKQYDIVSREKTTLYTYSLADPAAAALLASVSQDGAYHTSRKIGDVIYLFTDEGIGADCYGAERDSEEWVPLAGGEKITADCIYIPERGSMGLIISSVDLKEPDQILDNIMIVNNYAEIYVSTESVYLYYSDYQNSGIVTQIAKFRIRDGSINAAGAASVNGCVTDTFAVNEYRGMLRVLTNEASSGQGSSLLVLDDKLSVLGRLEGIAPGETIYAARYLGDMAYFVTYRNMDPLFAADLSEPSAPKLLGELKITGYSDYLHMWKEGTMFGIGYETDPQNSSRKGIKLAMFDTSDPVNLKVLDSVCIANADYSPALNRYKTVLADVEENLIGFAVTQYDRMAQKSTYLLFEWKDGEFHNILTEEIECEAGDIRGVYTADSLYIVTPRMVAGFDRTEQYRELGRITLE